VPILRIPVASSDHIRGNINASITLLEYGDYECPFRKSVYSTVKQLEKHFSTQLRFVFRHFPLSEIHSNAELAAETAEFAAAYDKFWQMHDLLHEQQKRLSIETLIELAEALGLSGAALLEALENKTYQAKIRSDFLGGVHTGVNGTPTFFINGYRHNGPFEFEDFVSAISKME